MEKDGSTLKILVVDQRTGPQTDIARSKRTGSTNAETSRSVVEAIRKGCPKLRELGIMAKVNAEGIYRAVSISLVLQISTEVSAARLLARTAKAPCNTQYSQLAATSSSA